AVHRDLHSFPTRPLPIWILVGTVVGLLRQIVAHVALLKLHRIGPASCSHFDQLPCDLHVTVVVLPDFCDDEGRTTIAHFVSGESNSDLIGSRIEEMEGTMPAVEPVVALIK